MTEKQLRGKVVNTAISYLGCKESDGSFKPIIDLYNTQKPLPVGYKMKYTDAWCAAFVTAIALNAGLTDIILPECGCERMIALYKSHKVSKWQENENITPQPGDVIFYDWQDNGVGDNTGASDHVGIVVSVTGRTIKVIEGNISNSVGYRNIAVNGKTIRGYGLPNYASKATGDSTPEPATPSAPASPSKPFEVGEIVNYTGKIHYSNANAATGPSCKPGPAKVTDYRPGNKHPYHLINQKGGGSTVYGWVDTALISKVGGTSAQTQTPTSGSVDLAVKYASDIIYANEGSYGSVNKNDNGALSIGKVQWHASRALSLMQTIVKANATQAKTILGTALYNEVTGAKSGAWNKRVVDSGEATKISALLTTTEGKDAQDALAKNDITTYIKKGMSYRLSDVGALIYFADGVNQYGTNATLWKNITAEALKSSGDVAAMFAATKKLTQNYLDRRERVYNAVVALKLNAVKV